MSGDNYMKVEEMSHRETSELIYEHQFQSAQLENFIDSTDEIFKNAVHIILSYGHSNADDLIEYIESAREHHKKQFQEMDAERPEVVEKIKEQVKLRVKENDEA